MQKFVRFATKRPLVTRVHAFHTSRVSAAILKFNLPAMSPTMTEGTIHKWKVKEGESFSAGDVLLELETDKAQIDVEAQDDGILAKILLQDGEKAPVNTPIALLAEEGDDISNIEIPADEPAADEPAKTQEEATKPAEASSPAKSAPIPTKPMDHHDIDTSALKKPLSPAVLNLVLRHHIKDLGAIKASGPGGRILKGDVLAHLGFIPYKPAPPMRTSAAPPRDQIVFAKSAAEKEPAKEKPVLPNFISKTIVVDDLFALRQALNEQHSTSVSVNDFIAKAATRALQDVTKPTMASTSSSSPVKFATDAASFSESYKGGSFKIFHLAPPTYDFITDSYEPPKPYELVVSASKPVASSAPSKSADEEMVDLIGYLGGEEPAQTAQSIKLTTQDARINFADLPRQARLQVELKLKDDKPGKILNDPKAASFLERVEYYVRNPSELTV